MPLHGKIVVIKRNGVDGTEFPLTATCLFGRKPDCDIRIQLSQVSKEHCRIDLNENKEVVLTNLSSVNPTKVNGEALQQSERLKHGDIITIIDRSFRFEYPPAPTPKKRSSVGGKNETLKTRQDQHVAEKGVTETGDKRISVVSTDPPLKDGTNNIQRSMDKTMELESNETSSPFSDLYQMIKKSLDVKTPRKSSASLLQTPTSRFCSPKPVSVKKNDENPITSTGDKSTPKRDESEVLSGAAAAKINNTTPKSVKKQRESLQVSSNVMVVPEAQHVVQSGAASPLRRHSTTSQRPAVSEGTEKDNAQMPKSPMRRRSKEATPAKPAVTSPKTDMKRASPRNSGKVQTVNETSKKRKSGELAADLPEPQMKKKRVSFGGHLTPELFDKRLPPDSPLRKGATPRRSLCLFKPKQSLLRRASVIGLLQEFDHENADTGAVQSPAKTKNPSSAKKASPKARSSSPKTDTPAKQSPKSKSSSTKAASPGMTSPKARSPSSKAVTPGKQLPKSRSPSPKAVTPAKKSPKPRSSPTAAASAKQSPKDRSPSPKAVTPTKKSPKSKSLSLAKEKSPSISKVGTPACQTPTVQGRFSVSRISTPSPLEETASNNEGPLDTETPKLAQTRKSTGRKSQGVGKSAVKAKCRRSSISRASMKVIISWADRVKFGRAKSQVAVPAKMRVTKGIVKKSVPKPKTPARKLESYASTGHANSPATIVVGRAHRQKIVHPTGAAPRLVTNMAVFKKDMKMDEDLTGIAEMYKTPVTKKKSSVINENSTVKTPAGDLGTSVVEPSVLNTPEELGEMMVSPLSVSSTVKDSRYNSEAVQRLFDEDHESSFVGEALPVVTANEDQQHTDSGISAATPKQKPNLPDCLTGVKRIMKTPKQKAEPIEDLRGKILKTPKQKRPVQQECLTGVKRIMKTPKQKSEPVEDLRGKILKTPKQKQPVQQECLTGVKRIMKTPKQKSELVEDLRGKILKTPKQKLEPQECLTGVKRIFDTPQAEAKPLEEPQDEQEVCGAEEAGEASSDGVEQNLEMPAEKLVSGGLAKVTNIETPRVRTPREKSAPVEDFVAMRRLMKTPRQKYQAVEEKFGIKRLVKTPRQKGEAPVEDFEGLKELMEEPQPEPTGQLETNEVEDQTSDCREEIAKELDIAHKEPQNDVQSNVADVPDAEMEAGAEKKEAVTDDHLEQLPHNNKSSDTNETISEIAVDEKFPVDEPKVHTSDENPEMETASGQEIESATDPVPEVKSVRGRRGNIVGTKSVEEKCKAPEPSEDAVIPPSVRGRRDKKTEATAPPTVRQTTRGRNAKTTESTDAEMETDQDAPLPSKVALKPKRGRGAKQAFADQAEIVQEVEAAKVPELEAEPSDVNQESNDDTAPVEKVIVKPRRGRRAKQSVQTEQEEVPSTLVDDLPQIDKSEETDFKEVVPSETDQNKSLDVIDDSPKAPEEEAAPCKVTEIDAPVVEKKSVRGRRAKVVESKSPEDKDEVTEQSETLVVPAPVRGRRGKKAEAAAPPAVRQTKRGRNAKSEDSPCDQPDTTTEAVSDQYSAVEAIQKENEPEPQPKEAVVKPTRGRKTKTAIEPAQPESEKPFDASEELPKEDAQPQQPIPSLGKSRRGKRTAVDPVEQPEVAEDTVATVETKESSKPPVRSRRGRNAKQEEEKPESNDKTVLLETTEPVKKSRRTRKAEEDHVEQREEQSGEIAVPDQAETPEPVKMTEQANTATKPRRGGRKAKQDAESQIPVESADVQEIPTVNTTEKPKRGKRGKKVTEEAEVTAVLPEGTPDCEPEPEAEEKKTTEPEASKPSRGRAAKKELSQVPAKRARRGAAPPDSDSNTESTDQVSESAVTSVEPPKRGRRAAAKPITDKTTITSDQMNPSKDSQSAVVEDDKKTKRSVKWKTDPEVFEIQKVTPVKAVRGRKSKFGDRVGSEGQNLPEKACITEEKDLSDNAVEAQPAKRARRGAKIVPTDNDQSTSKGKDVEAEMQPKTRRGRSAKK